MKAYEDSKRAHSLIKNSIIETPCVFSPYLSEIFDAQIFLKLENMQQTGSFKERGVLSFLKNKKNFPINHVVAASAGNHAQALSYHATKLNIPATIFMPLGTPNTKVVQTERYGAKVCLDGETYDDAYECAQKYSKKIDATYLHAYNHADVIAGQGTIGLEVVNSIGRPDLIVIPVGGGGLFAGIVSFFQSYFKESLPHFVGVEATDFDSMNSALKNEALKSKGFSSIAEGIAVKKIGGLALDIVKDVPKTMVQVDDRQIENAITLLLEKQKIVSEGAGAAVVSALYDNSIAKKLFGKKVVLIVSGGNIDISLLKRLVGNELVKSFRMVRMSITIADTPGSLSKLLEIINQVKGNIVEIHHERSFARLRWNEVLVNVTVETKNESHESLLVTKLCSEGYRIDKKYSEN